MAGPFAVKYLGSIDEPEKTSLEAVEYLGPLIPPAAVHGLGGGAPISIEPRKEPPVTSLRKKAPTVALRKKSIKRSSPIPEIRNLGKKAMGAVYESAETVNRALAPAVSPKEAAGQVVKTLTSSTPLPGGMGERIETLLEKPLGPAATDIGTLVDKLFVVPSAAINALLPRSLTEGFGKAVGTGQEIAVQMVSPTTESLLGPSGKIVNPFPFLAIPDIGMPTEEKIVPSPSPELKAGAELVPEVLGLWALAKSHQAITRATRPPGPPPPPPPGGGGPSVTPQSPTPGPPLILEPSPEGTVARQNALPLRPGVSRPVTQPRVSPAGAAIGQVTEPIKRLHPEGTKEPATFTEVAQAANVSRETLPEISRKPEVPAVKPTKKLETFTEVAGKAKKRRGKRLEDSELAPSTYIVRHYMGTKEEPGPGIFIPKGLKEEFGGWNRYHKKNGVPIDYVARQMFDVGIIDEPTVNALLEAKKSGRKSARVSTKSLVQQEVEAAADAKIRDLTETPAELEYKGKTYKTAVKESNNIRLIDEKDVVLKKAEHILAVEEKVPFDVPEPIPAGFERGERVEYTPATHPETIISGRFLEITPEGKALVQMEGGAEVPVDLSRLKKVQEPRFEETPEIEPPPGAVKAEQAVLGGEEIKTARPPLTLEQEQTPVGPGGISEKAHPGTVIPRETELSFVDTSVLDLIKKGFGEESGTVGKLTRKQQAAAAEARAARSELYRRIREEAARTGETLDEIAKKLKLPPGAIQRLRAEHGEPSGPPPLPSEMEGDPGGWPTSIKNAVVDQELQLLRLPPATKLERAQWQDAVDYAAAAFGRDPYVGQKLLGDLNQNMRPLSWQDVGILTHEWVRLRNLREAAEDQLTSDQRAEVIRNIRAAGDILNQVGTENSYGLGFRKMMMGQDYSLEAMERGVEAAQGGRPLEEADRAQIAAIHKTLVETQKAFRESMARTEALEAEKAFREAQVKIEAEAKAEAMPEIDPAIKSVAERILASMKTEADVARTRLHDKLSRLSVGVDPTIVSDLMIIGAEKIARGFVEKGRWVKSMLDEFGEKIRPFLDAAWEASQKRADQIFSKMAPRKEDRVRRHVEEKGDIIEQREAIKEKIRAKVDEGEAEDISVLARKLARSFVEEGRRNRDELIDAVHNELQEVIPDISRRETMDAISGYGQYKELSQDDISVILRDLKGQMQQVAKLEDIQSKRPPLKTGIERRSPTDEERRLIQLVNEAKRRFGIQVTDPARQLQSALGAVKTRLRNSIADLRYQIANRQKIVRQRIGTTYDAEALKLKAEEDALWTEFYEIFGRPEITDAQRSALAEKAVERSIADIEERIRTGNIGPRTRISKTPATPTLEFLWARRDALKEQLQELRNLANPKKTPDEIARQAYKTRLKNKMADMIDRMARGDFEKKPRRERVPDQETVDLQFKEAKVKALYDKMKIEKELAERGLAKRVTDGIGEIFGIFTALRASFDVSFMRQAWPTFLTHPTRVLRAFPTALRSMTKKGQFLERQKLEARPSYVEQTKAGLAQLEHEEMYRQVRWAEKLPLGIGRTVMASDRMLVTALNKIRADSFDSLVKTSEKWLGKWGPLTLAEKKAFANYANIMTGYGKISPGAGISGLNKAFFSPRLNIARMQMYTGQPLWKGSWRTRSIIAADLARAPIVLMSLYALAKASGGELEADPRSSDFGKAKFGNTRIDLLGGYGQYLTLMARAYMGEKKTLKGRLVPIAGEKERYGVRGVADLIMNSLIRSKLRPGVSTAVDIINRKNIVGEQVTPETIARDLLVPMNLVDIYELMVDKGMPSDLTAMILSVLSTGGISISTFDPYKKKKWDRRTFSQRLSDWKTGIPEYAPKAE